MSRKGKLPTDIKAAARVHTDTALMTLAKAMAAPDCPWAVRVAASVALMNRGWGQPHQSIDMTAEITTTKVIRTPTIAPNNAAWLEQHGDKPETLQ